MPSPVNALFDKIIAAMQLKNDAALSRELKVAPPVLSKLRHDRLPMGPSMAIKIHKLTGMPIVQIEEESGITF